MSKKIVSIICLALLLLVVLGVVLQWHRMPLLFHKIYIGATVLTMDVSTPVAQAVVTLGSRIVYVGDSAGALKHKRWYSSVIDLQGKTLMPGLFDAHSHFLATGLSSVLVDLNAAPAGTTDTLDQLYQRVAEAASERSAGEWIVGFNYDNTRFPSASHPDRLMLDQVAGDNPVYVRHHSGHMGVANSLALKQLLKFKSGILQNRQLQLSDLDPEVYPADHLSSLGLLPGGDQLSGLLQEKMAPPLSRFLSDLSPLMYWRVFQQARDTYLRYGYTTVQEGSAGRQESKVLLWLAESGVLPLRVNVWLSADKLAQRASTQVVNPVQKSFFQSSTVKIIADGSPQGATAFLSQPYFNNADSRGISLRNQQQLAALIDKYWRDGFSVAVHANGDAAIEDTINAVQSLRGAQGTLSAGSRVKNTSNLPVILVHAQTIRPDQLARLAALGISPSFFSSHSWYWGDWHRQQTLGERRAALISPTGSAAELQLDFTIHSDAPVTSPNPWHLLWITTNRLTRSGVLLGADERISRHDGLKAMTINAAKQARLDSKLGSITVGKLADLIVVNHNPLQIDDVRLLRVEEAIVNGVLIYRNRSHINDLRSLR